MSTPRVLLLDHRDSFAFLLGEQFARRGAELATCRADVGADVFAARVRACAPTLVVLSPGPGRPEDFPATLPWLRSRPPVPVFGVCLGHQAIGLACGARVVRASRPVHGRSTKIRHLPDPLTAGLPPALRAGRYHSLVVTGLPPDLVPLAVTDDEQGLLMAMRHRTLPWLSVQFHPESFLTPHGGLWIELALSFASQSFASVPPGDQHVPPAAAATHCR
jgi:anthranilate synthase/aminodeoxychorismate synthase-like glutamine amidotransferase